MPTDVGAIYARKSKAKAEAQTEITLLLICVIIWLANLVLLFAGYGLSDAVELMAGY